MTATSGLNNVRHMKPKPVRYMNRPRLNTGSAMAAWLRLSIKGTPEDAWAACVQRRIIWRAGSLRASNGITTAEVDPVRYGEAVMIWYAETPTDPHAAPLPCGTLLQYDSISH